MFDFCKVFNISTEINRMQGGRTPPSNHEGVEQVLRQSEFRRTQLGRPPIGIDLADCSLPCQTMFVKPLENMQAFGRLIQSGKKTSAPQRSTNSVLKASQRRTDNQSSNIIENRGNHRTSQDMIDMGTMRQGGPRSSLAQFYPDLPICIVCAEYA